MFGSHAHRASAGRRRGLTTFAALWPELRSHLHEVAMPNFDPTRLDMATVREVAALLEKRIEAVEVLGDGGCPACHEALAGRFVVQLRRLAGDAATAPSPGKAA